MEVSNQIGRRSPRSMIPAKLYKVTSKLYKTNGKALRNSRKCPTDVQKYPVTNNTKG